MAALLIQSTRTTKTTSYTERLLLMLFFCLGRPEEALTRLRTRYAAEISYPYTTLPEQFGYSNNPGAGSWNHAYEAVPAAIFVRHLAGIEPTSLGYETFAVEPAPGGLKKLSARIPTVRGEVTMRWEQDDMSGKLVVACPPGAGASVVFPSTRPWGPINAPGAAQDPENPRRFFVGPGEWSFAATAREATQRSSGASPSKPHTVGAE